MVKPLVNISSCTFPNSDCTPISPASICFTLDDNAPMTIITIPTERTVPLRLEMGKFKFFTAPAAKNIIIPRMIKNINFKFNYYINIRF